MKVNIKIRNLVVLLLTIAMTLGMVLTGCGSSGGSGKSSGSGGIKAFYSGPNADTFKQMLMDALAEYAKADGVDLTIGEPCGSTNEQVEQFEKAVADGYDAIVCLPVDRATALQLEIAAGDLPVIYVNACPDEQFLKPNQYMAVSSNEPDAGEYQAEYVYNKLGKPSSMNIIIFRGELTHNASVARSVSVKNWLRDNGVEVNVVFDDTANWSPQQAKDLFHIFQKTNQSFDAIFCNNDDMALGAVEALKEAGYDLDKYPVVGVDATVGGCESIANGEMQFTVYQSADGQAEKAIQLTKALASGGTADGIEGKSDDGLYIWVPFERVDASNVSNYMK